MMNLLQIVLIASLLSESLTFLVPHVPHSTTCVRYSNKSYLQMSSQDPSKKLVVISPPGGVGEVTAVKAATMGSSVRWFIVSQESNQEVVLSQSALAVIDDAGGSVELAGADAKSLLLPADDPKSAIQAVRKWCGSPDAIACTYDGVEKASSGDNEEDPKEIWKNAIKLASKEVAPSIFGLKLAILSASEDEEDSYSREQSRRFFGSFMGGRGVDVPSTLTEALGAGKISILRHGQLFGTPESSPDFSPLVGGPLRNPELCEEYTTRSVRIDPTLSVTGNVAMGKSTRSSRHSVGEGAALLLLGKVPGEGLDLCLSSQLGSEPFQLDAWVDEFTRSAKMLASGQGAQLFSTSFASVPDRERLADWLATKWAPAILRTYDIAAIRTGARPVYASRPGDGKIEIVWQELVDFKSVTVGKMIIEVTDTELVAMRGPGNAAAGFGQISKKPLNGENVLVQRLAEAASQAIDKGLAKKKSQKQVPVKEAVATTAGPTVSSTSSLKSSGTVEIAPVAAKSESVESGPRQTGARRSRERARGTRKRTSPPSSSSPNDDN